MKYLLLLIPISIIFLANTCTEVAQINTPLVTPYDDQYSINYEKYILPEVIAPDDIPNFYQKAGIGRELFFFEENGVSCATCHIPGKGFTAGTQQSMGKEGDNPNRKSPSSISVVGSEILLWDGRAGGWGINNMTSSFEGATANNWYQVVGAIAQVLFAIPGHDQNFSKDSLIAAGFLERCKKAYPKVLEKNLMDDIDIAECIAAFQFQSLMPYQSRQQKYLNRQIQLTDQELLGWELFEKNCEGCHKAPYLGDDRFTTTTTPPFENELHAADHKSNLGRYAFTGYPEDIGMWRIMRLQTNVVDHGCYGFSCEETNLQDFILNHQSRNPVSNEEASQLLAFLAACRDPHLALVGTELMK